MANNHIFQKMAVISLAFLSISTTQYATTASILDAVEAIGSTKNETESSLPDLINL